MANVTNSTGYQQYGTQPAIVERADPVARQETVQPRQAPAADSQRAGQRESRDDSPPADSGRGKSLDVKA